MRWNIFPIPYLLTDTNHVINTEPSKVNCVVTSNTDFYSCYAPKAETSRETENLKRNRARERVGETNQEMDQDWIPILVSSILRPMTLMLKVHGLWFNDRK